MIYLCKLDMACNGWQENASRTFFSKEKKKELKKPFVKCSGEWWWKRSEGDCDGRRERDDWKVPVSSSGGARFTNAVAPKAEPTPPLSTVTSLDANTPTKTATTYYRPRSIVTQPRFCFDSLVSKVQWRQHFVNSASGGYFLLYCTRNHDESTNYCFWKLLEITPQSWL